MRFNAQHLLATAGPLDPSDKGDATCEKYRRKFLLNAERALKRGANSDDVIYMITGTMVGMIELMLAAGNKEENIEKITADTWAFSIAQATRGRVVPEGAVRLATEYADASGTG